MRVCGDGRGVAGVGMAQACGRKLAGVYDSVLFRAYGALAADAKREGGPQGAASTGRSGTHGRGVRRTAKRRRGKAGGHLVGSARHGAHRRLGQLL
ncbi:hypothetical protein [Paenibacillus sp. IHBB 10380]|uniref:hypothetical protein n=1 Tax=Paenibacillus sp. IHBB 10380 TaxID=1566358 RepID=UPI001F1B3085|nr:hypothetical protein [Paenibacillus sp. IHBB 10380]